MKKKIVVLALFTTLLLTFICCSKGAGSADYYTQNDGAVAEQKAFARSESRDMRASGMLDAEETPPISDDSQSANLSNAERKLVKRANLRIRVENLEVADASVSSLLSRHDGYAASTNIDENSRYYSLRVPARHYDVFLSEMDGLGKSLSRRESAEDVTARYYDLEGRLATKKELLKTFQSYLGKAKNIEEILAVETRIAELQYDIDGTGAQLRNLANQVDYSTIELSIIGPITSSSNQKLTFSERIKQIFGSFVGFLSAVAMVIVGIIVYGIPALLILCLFFWLLFGRVGLLKKLWVLVKGKKQN